MTTLVIHPMDITTGFLEPIYGDKGFDVIDHNCSSKELKQAIKSHDRIIMCGHGDEYGLFGFHRYVVDSSLVYLLRDKICICIWCHADEFVNKYGLKGFYTGMFISEETEARYEGILATASEIGMSNDAFAEIVGKHIDSDNILEAVKAKYFYHTEVVEYNRERLYLND